MTTRAKVEASCQQTDSLAFVEHSSGDYHAADDSRWGGDWNAVMNTIARRIPGNWRRQ